MSTDSVKKSKKRLENLLNFNQLRYKKKGYAFVEFANFESKNQAAHPQYRSLGLASAKDNGLLAIENADLKKLLCVSNLTSNL